MEEHMSTYQASYEGPFDWLRADMARRETQLFLAITAVLGLALASCDGASNIDEEIDDSGGNSSSSSGGWWSGGGSGHDHDHDDPSTY